MAKTRSKFLTSTVKKEEREDKLKSEKELLYMTNNASKSKSKITKNRKLIQAQLTKVKSENGDDNKALPALPKKKTFTKSKITAEQIAKLISYVVNDKMKVTAAAGKVGLNYHTAYKYYHEYQDDPEHKIPLPRSKLNRPPSKITQEKIDNLIRYIANDGMSVSQASKKVDISSITAAKYYTKYLEDPEQKIPLLNVRTGYSFKRHTQEKIADLIGYIVRDKMSLAEASKKVNVSYSTAKRYYLQYLQNPNHEIPNPRESDQRSGKRCKNDQVKSLIGYIVNDGTSLLEASIKAHMGETSASKYYKQYLDDPEKNIPTPETYNSRVSSNSPTVDQVKDFFCYIIIDKLNVAQAALRAKIPESSGRKYYTKHLKSNSNQTPINDMTYSADKMKRLVKLVQNEKMSLAKAANTVHLNYSSASKHYKQYLKNPLYEFPAIKNKQYTQANTRKLIDFIERDKMNLKSAARRIKMDITSAQRYYKEYKNDPEHRIPVPTIRGQTMKNKTFHKYAQIIADIYKSNPSIKPICEIHDSELDVPDFNIKKELVEEDTKAALNIQNN